MNSQPQVVIKVPLELAQAYCASTPEQRSQIDTVVANILKTVIVDKKSQLPKQSIDKG